MMLCYVCTECEATGLDRAAFRHRPGCTQAPAAGPPEPESSGGGTALERQVGGTHYKDLAIQPIVYNQRNRLPHCEANVVKYVTRHRFKGGAQDIRKAIHNLELLLQLEYPEDTP